MPIPVPRLRGAALCGLLLALIATSLAEAKPKTLPGDLRVVSPGGKTLAEHTQYTGTVKIKTSRRADCFGPGTGGSGRKAKVPGATALGLVADGSRADRDLKPLLISDHFDFGVALCGIGRAVAPQSGYWYLKVDHVASQTGGDLTDLKRGDEILWYLIEDFNAEIPDELALRAPNRVAPGERFTVKVHEYSDQGRKRPAAGVQVNGAEAPTNARGRTALTLERGVRTLRAKRDADIPSNAEVVCAEPRAKLCPAGYQRTVAGTGKADRIRGSRAAETILARGGDDVVDVRKGNAADRVKCGGGRDKLILRRGQKVKRSSCERIDRRR